MFFTECSNKGGKEVIMENQFNVTICRFHTKAKNKLLIIGWFNQNEIGGNQLLVCLDKKKLPFSMEEIKIGGTSLRTRKGVTVNRQYYLWVDLPRSWRDCKCLEVKNFYNGVGNTAYSIPVSTLKKYEFYVQKYIDSVEAEKDSFQISGWYIDQGGIELRFLDDTGKEYPVDILRKSRSDVRKQYPENAPEEVIGFTACYTGDVPKKIRIRFEGPDRHAEDTATLLRSPVGKGVSFVGTAYKKVRVYYQQFGISATAVRAVEKLTGREESEYNTWLEEHSPSGAELEAQRTHKFAFSPKISIVVPLYKTPKKYLVEMIESVRKQSYENWELCLSDGSGEGSPIEGILRKYEKKDSRIKVVYNRNQLQISDNTNEALKISTGDYIAFTDHDDMLAPDALYECVKLLNEEPSTEIIYTDEDKVNMSGKEYFAPHFKPDFNPDMLYSDNYICHLFVVKRNVYEEVGMLNSEFDGSQDYDFVLRCVENSSKIRHIPKILYHWRAHKNSTAGNSGCKSYAYDAATRAIQAHYDRLGIQAKVGMTEHTGLYRSRYTIQGNPMVSVIIPNKDHVQELKTCISSLEKKNAYENLEIIIVENNSEEEETFAYYKELEEKHSRVKVVFWKEKAFNYSAINNFGVKHASGDYLLFLNNDIEFITKDCIEELLGPCQRSDVGAVGARLYYGDGTLQHAGVVIGLGGIAGHPFYGFPSEDVGYFGRVVIAQNYSAVTAACMMMKKSVFQQVGGFDEQLAVAYNDVDLCLKAGEAGYRIVYNPYAELYHYESKTRGYEDTKEKEERFQAEREIFRRRWEKILRDGDPNYNPNLTLQEANFGLDMEGVSKQLY